MTITLHLAPEVEASLSSLAHEQGVTVGAYVQSLVERVTTRLPHSQTASLAEFEAGLDALTEGTDDLPILAPHAFTREAIYGDR